MICHDCLMIKAQEDAERRCGHRCYVLGTSLDEHVLVWAFDAPHRFQAGMRVAEDILEYGGSLTDAQEVLDVMERRMK